MEAEVIFINSFHRNGWNVLSGSQHLSGGQRELVV